MTPILIDFERAVTMPIWKAKPVPSPMRYAGNWISSGVEIDANPIMLNGLRKIFGLLLTAGVLAGVFEFPTKGVAL
jgi:hypothetical protein